MFAGLTSGGVRGHRCGFFFLIAISGMPATPVSLEVEVYTFSENAPIAETREVLERIFESSSIQLSWTLKDPA